MRTIRHPGEPLEPRVPAVPCRARRLGVTFRPGVSVLSSVSQALTPLGIESAVVEISGGAFDPLVYVMPAESDDGVHAAWYSETHAPEGRAEIEALSFTYGRRDGEPFLHCHGVWRHADGQRRAGHLMPGEACFAEPVEATVVALSGAILDQLEDSETEFRLFTPVVHGGWSQESRRAVLCRVKPNEEICSSIEHTVKEHGIERASLHGVGSLVGCDFADGQHMASIASELFIRRGSVRRENGEPVASLDIAIVDINGRIFEGEILRGRNTVCVTFELLIVEV
ncbi:PCC domain-containing protein [Mesorhizobium sp. 1B3]|uniref:PCC domain-containing protein n=1 Tax=Mesorhizobium sp. 1B3 TaxID=3243599 RepID=UPI003D967BB7